MTIDVRKYFKSIVGSYPRRVRLGVGSFLTFDFSPMRRVDGHMQGEWRLWIYLSNWVLFHRHRQLVSSDTDRRLISVAIRRLEKAALTGVSVDSGDFKTTFIFGDFRLIVSPADYIDNPDERDEYWLLFTPEEVLAVGPKGVTIERAAVPQRV